MSSPKRSLRRARSSLRFVVDHPLNRGRRGRALARYAAFQVRARSASGAVEVTYGPGLLLGVAPGAGATNAFCPLEDADEMLFLLHVLGPGDRFVDIGANIGSYSIVAASTGATCIAAEPSSDTRATLVANIARNGFGERIDVIGAAVGEAVGSAEFTVGLGALNEVATGATTARTETVAVVPLDRVIAVRDPLLDGAIAVAKIDVEGHEQQVLDGGRAFLASPSTVALIVEHNGHGHRHGGSDAGVIAAITSAGFTAQRYDFEARALAAADRSGAPSTSLNAIYVRTAALEAVRSRLADAAEVTLVGGQTY